MSSLILRNVSDSAAVRCALNGTQLRTFSCLHATASMSPLDDVLDFELCICIIIV
jgi:hypothetical protein